VGHLAEVLRYLSEGHRFDSRYCHWDFFIDIFIRSHNGPRVVSASNRNEYQEYFLRVKTAGAYC